MARIYNFSAGPCTLPLPALEAARDQFIDYQGQGMSLIEMSHRSKTVVGVHEAAIAGLRKQLGVPDTHRILLLGGGATMQFSMIPANLLRDGRGADYTHSGAWAKKAIADAKTFGTVEVIWSGEDQDFMTLPDPQSLDIHDDAAYLHVTSNETIGGVQWQDYPDTDVPLVADMSSEILSRPVPFEKFGIIYAGAQKNIGPAGVALVIIRDDILERCPADMPLYQNYPKHAQADSMLNTPPVFQIWMIGLIMDWLDGQGGLRWAQDMAEQRSAMLYDVIDELGDFYRSPVDKRFRSKMNVVWRCPSEELEARFIEQAQAQGMNGLKGHRSVGGCRASIYNAMPLRGVEALAQFMKDFAAKNG